MGGRDEKENMGAPYLFEPRSQCSGTDDRMGDRTVVGHRSEAAQEGSRVDHRSSTLVWPLRVPCQHSAPSHTKSVLHILTQQRRRSDRATFQMRGFLAVDHLDTSR